MTSAQETSGRYVRKREQRARKRYLRLIVQNDSGANYMVQKHNSEWGDAHVIDVDGTTAVDCSCPDRQERGKERGLPCYHMLAWDSWTFDEVLFEDGTEEYLTERERP